MVIHKRRGFHSGRLSKDPTRPWGYAARRQALPQVKSLIEKPDQIPLREPGRVPRYIPDSGIRSARLLKGSALGIKLTHGFSLGTTIVPIQVRVEAVEPAVQEQTEVEQPIVTLPEVSEGEKKQ